MRRRRSYWFTTDINTRTGLVAFAVMGCPRRKAQRMEGFRRSAAPLVNQLSHTSSLFLSFFLKKKIPSWRKHVGSCLVCTATAELLVRWKSQQMGLIAGSELSGGEAPHSKRTGMSCCRPRAVMQMPNWGSTGPERNHTALLWRSRQGQCRTSGARSQSWRFTGRRATITSFCRRLSNDLDWRCVAQRCGFDVTSGTQLTCGGHTSKTSPTAEIQC